jgi:hypothetical protein
MEQIQTEHKRFIVIGYNIFWEYDTKEEVDKTLQGFYKGNTKETIVVLDTDKKTKTVLDRIPI